MIKWICENTALPVNVMYTKQAPEVGRLAELGVSRLSYGASPYSVSMIALTQEATKICLSVDSH